MPSLVQALLGLKPRPYGGRLIRIGGDGDGAYLVPDDLAGISICISPGAADTKLFEDELWDSYRIPSLLIDRSSTSDGFTTPMRPGQTLIQKWLAPHDSPDSISLSSALHHTPARDQHADCLLQLDIEGGEYLTITKASQNLLQAFRIIVIEFHNLGYLLRPWSPWHRRIKETIQVLTRYHACIHSHPNNCCSEFVVPGTEINLPQVLECTYLRRDRLRHSAAVAGDPGAHTVALPHPLDITNIREKRPLTLSRSWAASDASFCDVLRARGPRLRHYANEFLRTAKQRICGRIA